MDSDKTDGTRKKTSLQGEPLVPSPEDTTEETAGSAEVAA